MSEPFVLPPAPEDYQWGPGAQMPPTAQPAPWLDGHIEHLSASGIRLLKVCPEAWRHRYLLHEKERPGEALTMGSAVHDAMAFTHTQKIESHEDLPVPEVVEFFHDQAWPAALEKDGGVDEIRWNEGSKPDDVRRDGERVTRAYHSTVSPRVQPLKVEQRFEFNVPGVHVPLIGYIDIEEADDQIDYKTGKQVQRKADANWRLQGMIYATYTGKPTHFHSISRAKVPSIATPLESEEMMVSVQDSQKPLLEGLIRSYAEDVERYYLQHGPDEPWPYFGAVHDYRGGAACNFCGFRPKCGWWAHERV